MVKANYSTAISGQNNHQIPSLSMKKSKFYCRTCPQTHIVVCCHTTDGPPTIGLPGLVPPMVPSIGPQLQHKCDAAITLC